MPNSIHSTFQEFVKKHIDKTKKKKLVKKGNVSTLYAKRNRGIAIKQAANNKVSCIIKYTKITTQETKQYEVNVYSYKYIKLKEGIRKVLYAQDKNDRKNRKTAIKNFVVRNIKNVALTNRKYKPEWAIQI